MCVIHVFSSSLVGCLLTSDPDLRPSIWQVCEVVSRITGTTNHVTNVFVSTLLLVYPTVARVLLLVGSWQLVVRDL